MFCVISFNFPVTPIDYKINFYFCNGQIDFCYFGFSDFAVSCACFFLLCSAGGCSIVALATFGNQSLMGRNLNLCFICKVFWYSVDIVHADVVMERLHSKFWGSCNIGFCHFSITQISSLKKCWILLTQKCIFSQREDKIMHLVFYTVNLIFYNIYQVIYSTVIYD